MILSYISELTYFPVDQLRYAFCMFTLFPFCILYQKYSRYLNENFKHTISIVYGICVSMYCFGIFSPFHSLFTTTVVYLIMKKFKDKSGYIVFTFCMLYMSYVHIYRMWYNWMIWSIDVSGTQMLITIKLTSFAFEYADSFENESSSTHKNPIEVPSFLYWMGYIYFFPSFLTGPVISYNQYIAFITNYTNTIYPESDVILPKALNIAKLSFLYVITMYLGRNFKMLYMTTVEFATNYNILQRLLYSIVTSFIIRCRFYFAWTFSYACFIACGLTTDPHVNSLMMSTTTTTDNSIGLNVNPLSIEFAQNIYELTNNWNICTNEWLKEHIYKRAVKMNFSKQKSTYITNFVSAIWHGFYPGYMLSFIFTGMVTEIGRRIRSNIRPYFLHSKYVKILYDIICIISMCILLAYLGIPFQVYSFSLSFKAWYNLYFIGHLMLIGGIGLLYFVPDINHTSQKKLE
jgi:lysophospholipid acyltransferase